MEEGGITLSYKVSLIIISTSQFPYSPVAEIQKQKIKKIKKIKITKQSQNTNKAKFYTSIQTIQSLRIHALFKSCRWKCCSTSVPKGRVFQNTLCHLLCKHNSICC
jgi:hypothetical protein